MPDTIREQIIQNVLTRLAVIRTPNGYNSDVGLHPMRGIRVPNANDIPGVFFVPGQETAIKDDYGSMTMEMSGALVCVAEKTVVDPSVIQEQMLGDMIKNLTDPSEVASTLTESITYTDGGPAEIPESGDKFVAVGATFAIKYKTLIGNPYQQQ